MRLIEKFSSLFAVLAILAISVWGVGCGGDAGAPAGGGAPVIDDHGADYDDPGTSEEDPGSALPGGVEVPGDDDAADFGADDAADPGADDAGADDDTP